jgi:hypothetical protein
MSGATEAMKTDKTEKIVFKVQRRHYDEWIDGTGHHKSGHGEYPFSFRDEGAGKIAVTNARRRAKNWGHRTQFRLVRLVITSEVIA